jgi:hypothetical protein
MADEFEIPPKSRRAVVKTMGQVAVSAPAVTMLLSATSTSATALTPYIPTLVHIFDDFTFGDTSEDIDAIKQGSNFNPLNQKANLDDHV